MRDRVSNLDQWLIGFLFYNHKSRLEPILMHKIAVKFTKVANARLNLLVNGANGDAD